MKDLWSWCNILLFIFSFLRLLVKLSFCSFFISICVFFVNCLFIYFVSLYLSYWFIRYEEERDLYILNTKLSIWYIAKLFLLTLFPDFFLFTYYIKDLPLQNQFSYIYLCSYSLYFLYLSHVLSMFWSLNVFLYFLLKKNFKVFLLYLDFNIFGNYFCVPLKVQINLNK